MKWFQLGLLRSPPKAGNISLSTSCWRQSGQFRSVLNHLSIQCLWNSCSQANFFKGCLLNPLVMPSKQMEHGFSMISEAVWIICRMVIPRKVLLLLRRIVSIVSANSSLLKSLYLLRSSRMISSMTSVTLTLPLAPEWPAAP